jgi:ribosomal protein L30, bacterial/organelle
MSKLKITLTRSTIGQRPAVKATVRSLGLKKISSSVVQEDTPSVRGMIATCAHIVTIEEMK